jgi:tRNA(Ile)-lysidine synthase
MGLTVLTRVLKSIARYRMLEPGQRVGVAVSGGADSVCLLHVLRELAPGLGVQLEALHLDHGLRGEESRGDAAFVAEMARDLGLRCHIESADVAAVPDNLEQAARDARRSFFRRLMADGAVHRVATGHTRNDQAETVLFRFLRGSGTAGLAGILPVTAEGLVRPLLDVAGEETESWLRQRGIAWREDSSNGSLRFARNRIRHELLPQLVRDYNPSLVDTLVRTADWARAEEDYWHGEVDRDGAIRMEPAGGAALLSAERLRGVPQATARRLIRRAIECVKGDLRQVQFAHVEAILGLAGLPSGSGRFQAAGVDAFRSFDWLRLAPLRSGDAAPRNFRLPLAVPGVTPLPGGGSVIATELIEKAVTNRPGDCVYNRRVGDLDWDRVSGALELRNWRPGDQYQPIGHTGEHKLKELFQHARIPMWERRQWAVVTKGDEILWTQQFGPAAPLAATEGSRRIMRIALQPGIGTETDGV